MAYSSTKRKALVLVERDGLVCRRKREIEIEIIREIPHNSNKNNNHNSSRVRNREEIDTTTTTPTISSDQNKQILQLGGAIFILAVLLKALSLSLPIILVPLIVMGFLTCPDIKSFDARKELKRVFRGQHLPEDHPEKPKGWLAE